MLSNLSDLAKTVFAILNFKVTKIYEINENDSISSWSECYDEMGNAKFIYSIVP